MAFSYPEVIRALREFYGLLPHPPGDPFQFFLWEILSRDAIPARRDLAWQALRRIPALTPDAIFRAAPKTLLAAVGQAGPHRDERIESIRSTLGEFKRHREALDVHRLRGGGLRRAAKALRRLAHIEPSIRERALLYVGEFPVMPVDDLTARVVARLSGTAGAVSDGAEGFTLRRPRWGRELTRQRRHARRTLMMSLARDAELYRDAVLYLRHHAQHACLAVRPHCGVCPLASDCPSRQQSDT